MQAVLPYAFGYPHYLEYCCKKIKSKLLEHITANFENDESMSHGWATTTFIESCFGVADQMLVASQGSGIASILGPLLGAQSGFFSTPAGRLRSHLKAIEKAHGTKLTQEEKAAYLMKTPLVAMEVLPQELRRAAYKASRRRAIPLHRMKKAEIKSQEQATLMRREEEAKAKERSDSRALKLYKDSVNFPVYKTMQELMNVLNDRHTSGVPKYTAAMKCEIVLKQLQHRRDCFGRTLPPKALCSNHKGGSASKLSNLLESFAAILAEENETPALLQPPKIRAVYQSAMFPTALRRDLDKVFFVFTLLSIFSPLAC